MTLEARSLQGLAEFRYALRRFLAASEAISRGAGVTQQQYQALLAIRTWPGEAMTMKDLSEALLLTHHAAVQLVNRLETASLARRTASTGDRRSVFLSLTPRGAALVDRLAGEHVDEVRRGGPLLARSLRRLQRISPGGAAAAERL